MDFGQGDFSLFLLVDGLSARVDVVGPDGRRVHGRVLEGQTAGLGPALAMLLEGSPPIGRRAALLTDRLWTGVLRLPLEDPRALGTRGLKRSLALAAEELTGLSPDGAAVGFAEVTSTDPRHRYWATIADRRLCEATARVLRAEGSELQWIAHPAGLLRESSGLRVEAWADLTWCGGDGAPVHIVEGAPGEGNWSLAVEQWIESLRGSAPVFVGERRLRDLLSNCGMLSRRALLPQRRALELVHGVAARLATSAPEHAVEVDGEKAARRVAATKTAVAASVAVVPAQSFSFTAVPEPQVEAPAAQDVPTASAEPPEVEATPARVPPPAKVEQPVAAAVQSSSAASAVVAQPANTSAETHKSLNGARRDPPTAKTAPYPELPKRVSGAPWLVPAAMAAAVVGGIFWHQHQASSSLAAANLAAAGNEGAARSGSMPDGSLPGGGPATDSTAESALLPMATSDDGLALSLQGDEPARWLKHENQLQRHRLPALLSALGRHTNENFVVRRVAAKFGGALAVEGVGYTARAADQLASALASELPRSGWSVAPVDQRRRAFPSGREGYDFAIELTPVAVPAEKVPLGGGATVPNRSSRGGIVARLRESLTLDGATILASSEDEGAIARSSEELVALAQRLLILGEKPVGWRIDMRTSFPVLTRRLQSLAEEPDFLLPAALELDQSGDQGEIEVKLWLWI